MFLLHIHTVHPACKLLYPRYLMYQAWCHVFKEDPSNLYQQGTDMIKMMRMIQMSHDDDDDVRDSNNNHIFLLAVIAPAR